MREIVAAGEVAVVEVDGESDPIRPACWIGGNDAGRRRHL